MRLLLWMTLLLALPLGAQPPATDAVPTDEAEKKAEKSGPCGGGAVFDDGTVETGYSFVPNATDGMYVQPLNSSQLASRQLSKVCVCFLKTRGDDSAFFRVVFFNDIGGAPHPYPYAAVNAKATDIPKSVEDAGRFYEVDVTGVEIPEGVSYVGVRWNPSKSPYLFTCTDTSEETAKTPVYFREGPRPRWKTNERTKDPVFRPHRSIMLRTESMPAPKPGAEKPEPVPGLKLFKIGTASQTRASNTP